MFTSGNKFDLCSIPYSGRDSKMVLHEDAETRKLYLTFGRSAAPEIERRNLIYMTPVIDHKDIVKWDYTVEPGKLTINTVAGSIELCFAEPKRLRIRGKGRVSLRFYISGMKQFENGSPKEDGSVEVIYEILGKLLFVPVKGALRQDSFWNHNAVKADDFTIDLVPSVESDGFEAAIHEYYANGERDKSYPPFDECVAKVEKEFDAFYKAVAPGKNAEIEKLAAWTLWSNHVPVERRMKAPAYYSSKMGLLRAVGWQHGFIGMALKKDPATMYEALMALFAYQEAGGQIPNNMSDLAEDHITAGSPMQGLALQYLLPEIFALPADKKEALYNAMSGYAGWWLKSHSRDGSGIPQYYHPDECGFIDATSFIWGVPLQAPDLMAWLILFAEACGKLADNLGKDGSCWANEAKRLTDVLVSEFWKGDGFVYRNARTGKEFRTNSVLGLLPVILGKRLPADILEVLAADIADESKFMTSGGVVSEKLSSKEFKLEGTKLRGGINPAIQLAIACGLKDGGYEDLAKEIAEKTCALALETGLGDSIPPFAFDPGTGKSLFSENRYLSEEEKKNRFRDEAREPKTAVCWTSAGAAGVLGLIGLL